MVNDIVTEVTPMLETLIRIVDVAVEALLRRCLHLIVDWIQTSGIRRPQQR